MTKKHTHHTVHHVHKHKKDIWKISAIVLGILLIISLIFAVSPASISKDKAAQKAVDFINANLLQEGVEATLVSVKAEGDLYNIEMDIDGRNYNSYITKDGKLLFPTAIPLEVEVSNEITGEVIAVPSAVEGIETFSETGDEICSIDGKPIVRLFSTTWCPHCSWIKDTFDSVAKEYVDSGEIIAYHWELDIGDDTLTSAVETDIPASEQAVYSRYNPGGSIPTFVFACKYVRIGNGYEGSGTLADEEAEFRAIIEDILN